MTTDINERIYIGANGGPPLAPTAFELVTTQINDLYDEARNFADGEPIASAEVAEAVTALYDGLHEAGRVAEGLRVQEKKPLDDAVKAVQEKFAPFIKDKTGKVALGKAALGELLTAWRTAQAAKAEAEAAAKREEAARLVREAEAAIRASAGNLDAREQAEVLLKDAKEADKWAGRAERRATTGTGLRTVWITTVADDDAALTWAYEHRPAEFLALALSLAEAEVRVGKRKIPGFDIKESKVAT